MDFCAAKRNQFPVRIDMHVHMVGNGVGGSGGWLRLKGWHRMLAGFMIRQLGMPASALEGDLEKIYSEHLRRAESGVSRRRFNSSGAQRCAE